MPRGRRDEPAGTPRSSAFHKLGIDLPGNKRRALLCEPACSHGRRAAVFLHSAGRRHKGKVASGFMGKLQTSEKMTKEIVL